ncbi:MAG: BspA family leucine-rich repeat surface protein [Candidatus Heimdallarchaeota archaeon]|nr:BspA family leucine-rich repeat surface protein [Candidatus Heimdallarchaeota archaeon]
MVPISTTSLQANSVKPEPEYSLSEEEIAFYKYLGLDEKNYPVRTSSPDKKIKETTNNIEENPIPRYATNFNLDDYSADMFLTQWDTTLTSTGSSASDQITLPLESTGTYNFEINWNDSSSSTITSWNQAEVTHTYTSAGVYNITIEGTLQGWRFNNDGDRLKLLEIAQWGNMSFGNSNGYFYGAENLVLTAIDAPDLSSTTTLYNAFAFCSNLGNQGNMNNWDVSGVTSMITMFRYATSFNQPIDLWDVSSVSTMSQMFQMATSFNQPIGSWTTSSLTNLFSTFSYASSFNQSIDNWDVTDVTTLANTFEYTAAFNQPLNSWDTSNVQNVEYMFREASAFNRPLDAWNLSKVTAMRNMFYSADVFNQPIGSWDVSSVNNMNSMFYGATDFDQDLGDWNISSVTSFSSFFSHPFSSSNYDSILIGWSQLNVLGNITLDVSTTKYTGLAVSSRDILINTYDWVITDGGLDIPNVNSFKSKWNTTLNSTGSTNQNQVKLPLESAGTYDFFVDWGDGSNSTITAWDQADVTHTYSSEGEYDIIIDGTIEGWRFNNEGDKLKIIEISQWGSLNFGNSNGYFYGAENLVLIATDAPDLTGTTTLAYAFTNCYNLGDIGNMNSWVTGGVSNFERMFFWATNFNQQLSNWNTSMATNFNYIFCQANAFNQTIVNWDVSNVLYMQGAFYGADIFNQDISNWDVSNVITMVSMLGGTPFNQDISTWDVSKVESMAMMFFQNSVFNQDLSSWNVSRVTSMYSMFYEAFSFDQSLGDWNVSSVSTMEDMFWGVTLTTSNYNEMLDKWSLLNLQSGVEFRAGSSKYDGYSASARKILTDSFGWTIYDGGVEFSNEFISEWNTELTSTGSSASNQVSLPLQISGIYDFYIDWGDGSSDIITAWNQAEVTHTYSSTGLYVIKIDGTINGWIFDNTGDKLKLIEISQWGDLILGSLSSNFYGASNLVLTATDAPDLTGKTNLYELFRDCTNLGDQGNMNTWNLTGITDIRYMFAMASSFNQAIDQWDTSDVTTMLGLFYGASSYNQSLDNWDVSNVESMRLMFFQASAFNKPLNSWDTSKVSDMQQMFHQASAFNGAIGNWNTTSVTNMISMFNTASAFNQDIGGWNTSSLVDLTYMFRDAIAFNRDLNSWDLSGVSNLEGLFYEADSFNGQVEGWDVSNVDNFMFIFYGAIAFNQPLNGWVVSSAIEMNWMFKNAYAFNQPLSTWDVSQVQNMNSMFDNALDFDQDLGMWDVTSVTNLSNFLYGLTISTENYNSLLIGWAEHTLQTGVIFHAGYAKFTANAYGARQILEDTYDWIITDGGINLTNAFTSQWNTALTSPGSSNSSQVKLPTLNGGTYSFVVAWGDGSYDFITSWDQGELTHTYSSSGVYTIYIDGTFIGWKFNDAGDKLKIIEISKWGSLSFGNTDSQFKGASNLVLTATDAPNLSSTSSLGSAFYDCINLGDQGTMNTWDVSLVVNMSYVFFNATSFNQYIGNWDVSNANTMESMLRIASSFNQELNAWNVSSITNMRFLFMGASSFNQPLNSWDVSNVLDMYSLFAYTDIFNQTLSNWNVSKVTNMGLMFCSSFAFNQPLGGWQIAQVINMQYMFQRAYKFNQPLNSWDVTQVQSMEYMFDAAYQFNQALNLWDTSSVTTMRYMFREARKFNQDLNAWNVSKVSNMRGMFTGALVFNSSLDLWDVSMVIDMYGMFNGAEAFDQPIGDWNTGHVTDMQYMFSMAISFNKDISSWNVSSVKLMGNMFSRADSFNQPLNSWDVSGVTYMASMFSQAYAFNQSLNLWDVSKVTNMQAMFFSASSFNQDLSSWDVSQVTNMLSMLVSVTLSTENYDKLLIAWSQLNLKDGVSFHGGNSIFSVYSLGSRQHIIDTFGWTITDAGMITPSETSDTFISHWNTQLTSSGSSTSNQVSLPLVESGTYAFYVDWGDGTSDIILSWDQAEVIHTYVTDGVYKIMIDGTLTGWSFDNAGDRLKIIQISQWGILNFGNSGAYFSGAANLVLSTTDYPNLNGTTSMYLAFNGCSSLGSTGSLNSWDVSNVSNMQGMFQYASNFNQPLSSWDVSSVTNMQYMFIEAFAFNQPINSWNVSNVLDMGQMFEGAIYFNQSLNSWDVSHVVNMYGMFADASRFDQQLGNWNISSVIDMFHFFDGISLSHENYDLTMKGWAQLNLQAGIEFHGGSSMYSGYAASARQILIDIFSWTIHDQGIDLDLSSTFKTQWETSLTSTGSSNFNQIHLPLESSGLYDFYIDWGDGTSSIITSWDQSEVTHTYSSSGVYIILLQGVIVGWKFGNNGDKLKIRVISQWGSIKLGNNGAYFSGAANLELSAIDKLNLSETTNLQSAFSGCSNLGYDGEINHWNTSTITDMSSMFFGASNFNMSVSSWNVSKVTTMYRMFSDAYRFNISLADWDISNVSDLSYMFNDARDFNQPLGSWNLTGVNKLERMFYGASSFNQDISSWDVSSITNMDFLFANTDNFNQDIESWNVSSVISMEYMFNDARAFNQSLNSWDVSNVESMVGMFMYAIFNGLIKDWDTSSVTMIASMFNMNSNFNQNISSWDVSKVTSLDHLFAFATSFNQPLNSWIVSSVTTMESMFEGASSFNQPLDSWDVFTVRNFVSMFREASSFNQPLNSWNIMNTAEYALDFSYMFCLATSFDQAIDNWDVSDVRYMSAMFDGVTLSTANYDAILVSWSVFDLHSNVYFDGGNSKYSYSVYLDRKWLIDEYSWTIADGGMAIPEFNEDTFISTWNTELISDGSSYSYQIQLPLETIGDYYFFIDWGDGSTEVIYQWDQALHSYGLGGNYTIRIVGRIKGWRFNLVGDRLKLLEISQWGIFSFGNSGEYFRGAENFVLTATDSPDLSETTILRRAFDNCHNLGDQGDLNSWDVSKITDMSNMFAQATSFNMPIGLWNVSSVSSMHSMFYICVDFNIDISQWNTSSVTNMYSMFAVAMSFNHDISNWDVSNVELFYRMFNSAYAFNQPIGAWNTESATDMNYMFFHAIEFNQSLSNWNVSNVISMEGMFRQADNFNQDLSIWDVSNVENMIRMFYQTSNFDQDLGSWNISSVTDMSEMFLDVSLSTLNYDATLQGWATNALQSNIQFHGGNAHYYDPSLRQYLIDTYNWTITDAGSAQVPSEPLNLNVVQNADQLVITWDVPESDGWLDITEYRIYRSENATSGFNYLSTVYSQEYSELIEAGSTYFFIIRAYNLLGLGENSTVMVFDTFIPFLSTLQDQVIEYGTPTNITWQFTDLYGDEFNLWINDELNQSGIWETEYSLILSLDSLVVGRYNFTLQVVDSSGNMASDQLWVDIVDTTSPQITGSENFSYELGSLNNSISWLITDYHADRFSIYGNGSLIRSGSWQSGIAIILDIDDLYNGFYNFSIIVFDQYNNTASDELIVQVLDTTLPTISHPSDILLEFGLVFGNSITWTCSDVDQDLYYLFINGTAEPLPWNSSSIVFELPTTFRLGLYNLTLVIVDGSGNSIADTVFITIQDTTSPQVSNPADKTEQKGSEYRIEWSISDLDPESYIIMYNSSEILREPWEYTSLTISWPVNQLEVGYYNITLVVQDGSGNTASDSVMITIIDTTEPEINEEEIKNANKNVEAGGTMVVFVDDENEIVKLEYSWDGENFEEATAINGTNTLVLDEKTRYYFELNVPEELEGEQQLSLKATDAFGNTRTISMTITLPTIERPTDYTIFYIIGGVILFLVALSIFKRILGKRKEKKRELQEIAESRGFTSYKEMKKTQKQEERDVKQPKTRVTPTSQVSSTSYQSRMTTDDLPAPTAHSDVFISFSSKDKKVAEELYEKIRKAKQNAWISSLSIDLGQKYSRQILDAIDSCKIFIILISKHSTESRHVETELERGFSKGKDIMPIVLDDQPIPRDWEYFLTTSQWKEVHGMEKEHWMAEVIRNIQLKLGKSVDQEIDDLLDKYDKSDKKG